MSTLTITTKEHWAKLESRLLFPGSAVHLIADGTRLDVQVELNKLSMVLVVYINGEIKWGNCSKPDELAAKFWRKKVVRLYSHQKKATILKDLPKRQKAYFVKELGLDASREMWEPIFRSFSSFKAQLSNNSEHVQWVNAPELTEGGV